jgi:uncharacterized protein YndB with AHSA1/START domain
MAHPFELSYEIEVDAAPEEVWEAIATGPAWTSWFMGLGHHLYSDVVAGETQRAWASWLTPLFA